ncbi:MAG: Holliday junction resolvase RecU [Lachnospiraceae bacterium]|nr:Holliday junction resolvase RecU [Lachnospiraceae bacterium]
MGYWHTRGLRGSALEDLINYTNEVLRQRGLALVQKIPTPITPMKYNKDEKVITLAYFDNKSTVDYIGAVQGIPICFDAKQTGQKNLPIQNIHAHQMEFMEDFNKQGGVAFLLIYFSEYNRYFFLPVEVLKKYWGKAQSGGRKSIPYSAFEDKYELFLERDSVLNYLEGINTYLNEKG